MTSPVRLPSRAAILSRAAGSMLALVGLLGGVPLFLATQIGWPLPRTLPNLAQLQAWLVADHVDDLTALKILACIAWVAWAQLSTAVILEMTAAARHTTPRPIRLLGPAQLLAASLMGALLMLAATRGTTSGGPPAPQPRIVTDTPTPSPASTPGPAARPLPPAQLRSAIQATDPATPRWRDYKVVAGDTLWDIAAAQLGDPHTWPRIYRANTGRPQPDGRTLHDPDLILPGWTLRLPTPEPAANGDARPAGGRPATGPTNAPTPPAPTDTPNPAVTSPPPPTPAPHGPGTGQHSRPHQPDAGIRLPTGGYTGLTLAAAAAAAITVLRIRRRIHHRLDQPGTATPGVRSLPQLLRALRRIWLTAAPATPAPGTGSAGDSLPVDLAQAGGGPVPGWPYPPGVLPLGAYPNGEDHLVDVTAAGGLALTGPDAAGLVRHLLVSVLGAGAPTQHAHHARIVIPRADLVHLLGPGTSPDRWPPRLVVTATLGEALDRVEAELLARGRLLDSYDIADVLGLRRDHPDEDPLPPLLLICRPDPDSVARIRAVLAVGAARGIGGLILGPWPTGTTWPPDHADHPTPATQLLAEVAPYTLAAEEATQLLALWRDAAAATDPFTPLPATPTEPDTSTEPDHSLIPAGPPAEPGRAARPVQLRLFGPPTLLINGAEISTGLRSLGRALLTYLALHRDGVHGEAITDALWPDTGPTTPPLHPTISRVRALLRHHTGLAGAAFITHRRGRYRLDPDLVDADVWQFSDTLATPRDHPDRVHALQAAAALYSGPFAQHLPHDWTIAPAEDLRLQAISALAELAAHHEPFEPNQALQALEQALHIDEYNEQLHQRVMILQARLDRTDDIRRTYRMLEHRLYQLDLQPSQETEHLRAELLGSTHDHTDRRPPAA